MFNPIIDTKKIHSCSVTDALTLLTYFLLTPAGLTVLLSPSSAKLFSSYNLPFPGHVLIYGPPVSSSLQVLYYHFGDALMP